MKLNLPQKFLLDALIVGATIFFVPVIGDYSWTMHGIGVAGLIFCIGAFIKLFESPFFIRVYDTELAFEQKTTSTII